MRPRPINISLDYLQILQLPLRSIAGQLKHGLVFQQDPEHTSNLVLETIKQANKKLLERSIQRLNLNPSEIYGLSLKARFISGNQPSIN